MPEQELRNAQGGLSHDETQEIPRVTDAPEPQRKAERRGRHAKPDSHDGHGNHGWGAPGWGEQEHRSNPYKDGQDNER